MGFAKVENTPLAVNIIIHYDKNDVISKLKILRAYPNSPLVSAIINLIPLS